MRLLFISTCHSTLRSICRLALNKLKMGDEADPSSQPAWKKRRKDEKDNADLPKIIGTCHERFALMMAW